MLRLPVVFADTTADVVPTTSIAPPDAEVKVKPTVGANVAPEPVFMTLPESVVIKIASPFTDGPTFKVTLPLPVIRLRTLGVEAPPVMVIPAEPAEEELMEIFASRVALGETDVRPFQIVVELVEVDVVPTVNSLVENTKPVPIVL
jgi:hypothetical protein